MALEDSVARVLDQRVSMGGRDVRFGDLRAADVDGRASELRAATGWGPTARVAPVALAWRELATAMRRSGVDVVADLDGQTLEALAPRLWIVPPPGGLL